MALQKFQFISDIFLRFCTALRFLTVVPITWRADEDGGYFKKSLLLFPAVGLLIGCGAYVLSLSLSHIFPQSVLAVVVIVYLAAISGALHLDGLCDSADGLLSSRSREKSLLIMKDSRVGAMGVISVAVILFGKYSALSSMPAEHLPLATLFMPITGRSVILLAMATARYARPEGGIGELFYSQSSKFAAVLAFSLLTLLLLLLVPEKSVAILLAALGTCFLFTLWCKNVLGGMTGDTLGAACELTETTTAIAFTLLIFQ